MVRLKNDNEFYFVTQVVRDEVGNVYLDLTRRNIEKRVMFEDIDELLIGNNRGIRSS